MSFTLNIETDFSSEEVTEAIRSAIEHEKHVARYKIKSYSTICRDFEAKFGLSSAELRTKLETEKMIKESSFLDWYEAKKGLDHWSKRLEILSGVSFK
ncbi:hypothetical protein EQO05_06330 [Methanosarcina sp. MSH10X1]|uniref:hypothetical protein n=1 Tax=Methanosarcina sp. MSH10X1 TaxID=2507075 RepID=UPI000FFB235A|nr:hypothetical protein [Methanosarcina sp. MSH10X1]RXA20194.1 hypothetical protein EQO05_06330 [Methanosarcina sp. MSH10X1]